MFTNTIYKIECEHRMPIANGYFSTREKAEAACKEEDWSVVHDTLEGMLEYELLTIEEITVK